MKISFQTNIYVIILCCIKLSDAASVNLTLSSHNVQDGSSLILTAEFDPALGESAFNDLQCGADKRFTKYNSSLRMITIHPDLSPSDSKRLNITASGRTMVLVISPITFGDEKTSFNCILWYNNSGGTLQSIASKQHRLENVYSPPTIDNRTSIMSTTVLKEGQTANLYCIATGRPAPTIIWQYNSSIHAENTTWVYGSPLISVTSQLKIWYPTQLLDGQKITCLVIHQFALPITRNTTIIVPCKHFLFIILYLNLPTCILCSFCYAMYIHIHR